MPATTAVGICSNALLRLGADPINSFNEAEPSGSNLSTARLAANLWPTVRRQVLRGHPWNCAETRVLLSPDETAPAFGWTYRFLRPSDWLRTISVGLEPEDRYEYISEGAYLLSNESSLPLRYVFDNENPATYDASLVAALEVSMAAAMAYPVTKSTSLAQEMMAIARTQLGDARTADGQDDPAATLGDFPILAARFGSQFPRG